MHNSSQFLSRTNSSLSFLAENRLKTIIGILGSRKAFVCTYRKICCMQPNWTRKSSMFCVQFPPRLNMPGTSSSYVEPALPQVGIHIIDTVQKISFCLIFCFANPSTHRIFKLSHVRILNNVSEASNASMKNYFSKLASFLACQSSLLLIVLCSFPASSYVGYTVI